jgi:small subunit ribosomal protein S21
LKIKVIDDQLEKAIKALKIRLAKDGMFRELKRRRFYEKPSVRKKRKQAEARRRWRKTRFTFT